MFIPRLDCCLAFPSVPFPSLPSPYPTPATLTLGSTLPHWELSYGEALLAKNCLPTTASKNLRPANSQ